MIFTRLKYWFRSRTIHPIEMAIVDSIISGFGEQIADVLRKQVEAINHVQRHQDGKEVCLYRTKFSKAYFDEKLRLPGRPDEELLATVVLRLPETFDTLTTKVWMVGGRIFSIEFDDSPGKYLSNNQYKNILPEIVKLDIHTALESDPKLIKTCF